MAELLAGHRCVYCNSDVSDFWIKCAECPGDFNLCPQCFACGAEIGDHLRAHSYYVKDADPPLFHQPEKRKGSEELKFLTIVERFKFGNWVAAAELMACKPSEVENHYVDMYLHGNIGKATHPSYKPDFKFHIEDFSLPVVCNDDKKGDYSSVPSKMLSEINYKPNAHYFGEPYDFEAESDVLTAISGQSSYKNEHFSKEESSIHKSLELACVNIYRDRLKKRHGMEQLVRDYNLVKWYSDMKSTETDQMNKDKEESKLRNNMRVFCRLWKPEEHEKLVQGDLKEKTLKAEFLQLKEIFTEQSSLKNNAMNGAGKPEPVKGKRNKTKENKNEKNSSTKPVPAPDAAVEKELKTTSSSSSANRSRKRPFQEGNYTEALYAESCHNLLTQAEKKLCSTLSLEPSSYMALKIVLLKEYSIIKEDTPNAVCNNPSAHGRTVRKVAKFMSSNGWIKAG